MAKLKRKILHSIKRWRRINVFQRSLILIALLLLVIKGVSGTFAWFTSSDQVTNAFAGTQLTAEINETFTPKNDWTPGTTETKQIRVKNTGSTDAFVRVSLYEFFLSFRIDINDQTGNGNIATTSQSKQPEVDGSDPGTWKLAAESNGTYPVADKFYISDRAWVSDPKNKTGMYIYNGTQHDIEPFKFITLNFSTTLKTTVQSSESSDYWLYEDGYFYYSRPLKPGQLTTNLLESLSLSESFPNRYKGALYKMQVYMDAHDVSSPVLSAWALEDGSAAYDMISQQVE